MCVSTDSAGRSYQLHPVSLQAGRRTRIHERISLKSLRSRGLEILMVILFLVLVVSKRENWLFVLENQRRNIIPSVVCACAIIFAVQMTIVQTWMNRVTKSTTSALSSVTSLETLSRIRSSVNQSMNFSSVRLFSLASKCSPYKGNDRMHCLSSGDPFLSKDDTGKLLLSDVKEIFLFASTMNRSIREKGPQGHRAHVQKAMESIEAAITFSRGPNTRIGLCSNSTDESTFGDTDALAFIAACRIFAEWRNIRLVPDGYPRYAMGMGMARRDLLQNLGKVETAVHDYIKASAHSGTASESPTLRQLMQYEISRNVHPKLPRLSRQTLIFSNLRQIPFSFPDSKSANQAAYHASYNQYHNFFTRQIFQATFDVAPHVEVVTDHMNLNVPNEFYSTESSTQAESVEAESINATEHEHEDTWIHLDLEVTDDEPAIDYNLEPHRFVDSADRHKADNPLERLGNHLQDEWSRMISQCAGVTKQPSFLNNAIADQPIRRQISFKVASNQFCTFVEFMQPIIDDLDKMIEELNMNDPSKV